MTEKKQKKVKSGKAVRRTSIGGQAVLEGVMMKGERSMATAVRAPGGDITVESKYVKSAKERNVFFRLPFVRGVVNLFTQLVAGTGIIMRSAEVYGDFAEPSKFDKWVAKKFKINPMNLLMFFSVILGIALAVGMFVFLPNFLASLICDHTAIAASSLKSLWYSLIEGGLMLSIFIAYILLVTLMKDVRRVFMYHGAEHKVISCYEHGLELTVENAKKMKREHSRCGTTFLFFVVAISIIVFVLVNFMLEKCGLLVSPSVKAYKVLNALIKLGFKLLFLPVVAGVSYELLKLLAKSDCLLVRIIRAPGMALQLLTTKEPTDDMLEVSITAFKTVQAMDADNTVPERKFDIRMPYASARERLKQLAPLADEADIDWILAEATGELRSNLGSPLTKEQFESAQNIARRMADGCPLQYALGYTDFYGNKISLNQNVLIPRPETEELTQAALNFIAERGDKGLRVLDLCTGSGAIAVTIAKRTGCEVVASDIMQSALDVAAVNALNNGVKIETVLSDMFDSIEGKFDVIVCNPPYIPTAQIEKLDKRVKDFEPRCALDGGEDGLKFYRIISKCLDERLNEGGALFLEIGVDEAQPIRQMFDKFDVQIFKDLQGIERVCRIQRKQ